MWPYSSFQWWSNGSCTKGVGGFFEWLTGWLVNRGKLCVPGEADLRTSLILTCLPLCPHVKVAKLQTSLSPIQRSGCELGSGGNDALLPSLVSIMTKALYDKKDTGKGPVKVDMCCCRYDAQPVAATVYNACISVGLTAAVISMLASRSGGPRIKVPLTLLCYCCCANDPTCNFTATRVV